VSALGGVGTGARATFVGAPWAGAGAVVSRLGGVVVAGRDGDLRRRRRD
jgi:hypothetical protein